MKLQMPPSFPPQVDEITVHVLRTCSRLFIKLKTWRDFSKSTVIHAGEMLWDLRVEKSVCHFLKEMHADVNIFHINNQNSD